MIIDFRIVFLRIEVRIVFFIKDFRIVDFTAIAALFSLCSCMKHWLKRDANSNQQSPCIEPSRRAAAAAPCIETFRRAAAAAAFFNPPRATPTLLSLAACQLCGSTLAASTAASIQDLISQVLRHFKATSCQAYIITWQAEHEPIDDTIS